MASFRLNQDLEKRLDNLAAVTGRTKTFYVRKLVEDNIDDLELQYIAEHRLENPSKLLSSAEMRADLGLDN